MSDGYQRIEVITGTRRRRRWTTDQKVQIIEQSFEPGETVSSVARRIDASRRLNFGQDSVLLSSAGLAPNPVGVILEPYI